ncbi:MAG: hypothetical protein KAR33_05175, partial [Candidatus Thorarchaeota archaeon]|nr:hypothetical protein [Candidatus Thorarchaeota archaeon]
KSILSYLTALNKSGLVTTGTTINQGKRVVFHELTKTGWSLARVFFEGVPSDVHELTSYLLEDYLTHIVSLFKEQDITSSTLFDIFTKARANALLSDSTTFEKPDFLIIGASAYYTHVECTKIPSPNDSTSCEKPVRFPGGPTIALANSLADSGYSVSLVSAVGNDQDGWNLLSDLIQRNIDITNVSVEDDKNTNETILIEDQKGSRSLIGISPNSALSITSPSQVPWSKLENTKAVYIGEVFTEVAAAISAYARSKNIPVVYRCSVPYLERGLDQLGSILNQIDALILSHRAWRYLKKSLRKGIIQTIRNYTATTIIIRDSAASYTIHETGSLPLSKPASIKNSEMSDVFSNNLLVWLTKGFSPREAAIKAIEIENE